MRLLFIFTGSIAVSMLFAFCFPEQQPGNHYAEKYSSSKQSDDLFVAFYNVENLFDTTDDPGIDDAEFLPSAKNPWTNDKYKTKVSNIAKVIRAMNDGNGADIVGLAEVENIGVVKDLASDAQLKSLDYGVVHHESPDTRGIDVAMIYKKKSFRVTGTEFFHVDISKYEEKPTRDIVLVKGIDNHKDTLFIFLNHCPPEEEEPNNQNRGAKLRLLFYERLWIRYSFPILERR
ncbi:MAG TPA: hypothetical protein VHQ04_07655 [Puia sp.]|nr:hypothetical protein [Puia sp.]